MIRDVCWIKTCGCGCVVFNTGKTSVHHAHSDQDYNAMFSHAGRICTAATSVPHVVDK